MIIKIDRKYKKDTYTIGKVYINDDYYCDSLEDKDRGLKQSDSIDYIKSKKVYGQTAIPSGTYKVTVTYSNKFANKIWGKKYGGKVPLILNIKGFDGVRFHPLSTPEMTLGCIGLGKNTIVGKITNTLETYYKFMDKYIMPCIKRGEEITLIIE